ncbi:tRNA splicing endonuclease subunit [Phlyctema vagabunda]|uniref:tRNA splicing endonuclease subunit n=1 Tax=Phlyctema vagabunda TaxID=108571 RepID=A0ABR4PDS8_9HELO
MTDIIDEDAPVTSLHNQPNEDNDPSDETQDFRFIAALTGKAGAQIPKRGEKDFEPHGTKQQDGILDASRQAMHDVLDHTRVHIPKGYVRGFYYGSERDWEENEQLKREGRKGLSDDHVVVAESTKGPHFRVAGKTPLGVQGARLWLLPEEALYLVERGNLDLWWPPRQTTPPRLEKAEEPEPEPETDEKDEGVPISLQAAYAILLGQDGDQGRLSLERYTVYANLKRTGYVVLRAPEWDPDFVSSTAEASHKPQSLFAQLFGTFFAKKEVQHSAHGPLVQPGMYRSYNTIYQQLAIIPRHKPAEVPVQPSPAPSDPFRVVFHVYKPINIPTFSKSNPGEPDFRVAVINARTTAIPTLHEISSLLESTPWDPPKEDPKNLSKTYQRLRHGYRNVILAVVDQGIISYLRVGEAAFGEEELHQRFDRNVAPQGSKRGGGGRGRGGRGRGRGRGRGGRS